MNNPMGMLQQFQAFAENFSKTQKNPREAVQELLNSGKMTQAQYNQLSQMASQIMGRKN